MASSTSPCKHFFSAGKSPKEHAPTLISTVATYAALAILSLTIGYWAGVGSSLPITRSGFASTSAETKEEKGDKEISEEVSDSEDEAPEGEELSAVQAGMLEECKLVLVVRTDLGMTTGKIAAQYAFPFSTGLGLTGPTIPDARMLLSHVTKLSVNLILLYELPLRYPALDYALTDNLASPTLGKDWVSTRVLNSIDLPQTYSSTTRQTKVALRADNEEELDTLEAMARSLNLCARSIHDAGRTQIAAGSRTILGVGPGPARLVNQVTGKLKLL